MGCRARVCSECATKIDGINHCVQCLAGSAELSSERSSTRPERPGVSTVAAGGYLIVLTSLLWIMFEVMLPG